MSTRQFVLLGCYVALLGVLLGRHIGLPLQRVFFCRFCRGEPVCSPRIVLLVFPVFSFDFSVLTFSRSAPTFSSYLSYRPHGRYLVMVLRDPSLRIGMTASRFAFALVVALLGVLLGRHIGLPLRCGCFLFYDYVFLSFL